jgi:uncharacterized protein YceK
MGADMKRNIGAESEEISNIGRVLYPFRACPWSRIFTLLLGIMLVVACSGCAVSVSRGFLEYKENPKPYPSVRANFGYPEWPLNMKADGFDVAFDFSKPLSLLILPIDLPISIVVDTVLLPMDLFNWRMDVVNERYVRQALYSENMPSAEEFRKNYKRLYSQYVIRDYLHEPSDRISQVRLDMLLNAGVSTRLMAESNLISEDFANRLIDRILLEARNAKDWEVSVFNDPIATLLQNKMIPPATLRRLAGLGKKELLPYVAANERTPPDVLRTLSEEHSCIEFVAKNNSSPPDVLSKLAGNPKYAELILGNHNTSADMLLKMINVLPTSSLDSIARHPNATAAVDDAIIKYGKQMFAKGDLAGKDRYMIDKALKELLTKDLPRDKLLALAALPYPTMLAMLSQNKNADADVLVKIVNTCRNRKADANDAYNDDFNLAVSSAQQRLQNPDEGLNTK